MVPPRSPDPGRRGGHALRDGAARLMLLPGRRAILRFRWLLVGTPHRSLEDQWQVGGRADQCPAFPAELVERPLLIRLQVPDGDHLVFPLRAGPLPGTLLP